MNNTTDGASGDSPDLRYFVSLYEAINISWKVWPPFILLVGGLGNIATILVMRRIKGCHSSQHVILIALAVADFSILYTGLLRLWLLFFVDVDVRRLHTVLCKLHLWLVYSCITSSAWLLTCVTVQRALAVTWPHRVRAVCTARRAGVVVAAVVVTTCSLHFHLVLGMRLTLDISQPNPETECDGNSPEYIAFRTRVFPWLDMCLSSFLPSICQLVCDVVLSRSLFRASFDSAVTVSHVDTARGSNNNNSSSNNSSRGSNARRKTASRTTAMVLVLSFTFLSLTLPLPLYVIWNNHVTRHASFSVQLFVSRVLVWTVTTALLYTNSAVNFILYCLTGTRFRQEFWKLLTCGRDDRSAKTGREAASTSAHEQRK
ncbi:hypothetical protein ACOMHN_015183 [Nucella lapillus]